MENLVNHFLKFLSIWHCNINNYWVVFDSHLLGYFKMKLYFYVIVKLIEKQKMYAGY